MRIGHALPGLRHTRQFTALRLLQRLHNEPPPEGCKPVVQDGCRILRQDVHGLPQQHVAGIQTRIHLHDGHARLLVTRLDGAVNGGRPAPARQQAGVNVQASSGWRVQHPLGKNQAIGSHHHDIGLGCRNGGACLCRIFGVLALQPQAARLHDGNAMLQRMLFDG